MDARMSGRYMTSTDIQSTLHIGKSHLSNIRRFIKDHPERYTHYAVIGHLTNVLAVIDAMAFRPQIEAGCETPEFNRDAAATMLGIYTKEVR